jgi:hypothetical protein
MIFNTIFFKKAIRKAGFGHGTDDKNRLLRHLRQEKMIEPTIGTNRITDK